ncbi:MAG: ATP-binding cassette domain-containing protein [Oscillospiraceae bacterium]|nr:ATP-binding cassette domain-containing protein [Oscillospiraceae bacterium]
MTTIELKNVTKTIQKNTVLDDISVSMASGTVYGFQGINGSGKTMLMRIITGLIFPTRGKVFINSKELAGDIFESVGLLLENPSFLDDYTAFQNLKMLSSIRGVTNDDEIKTILNTVGLGDMGKKKYRKFSLGMKQRLGIAAAVVEKPNIVILDEPTNSLDANGVEMVQRVIQAQKERGALVILSCHDLSVLQAMSDEIIVLQAGKFVQKLVAPYEK